MDTDSGKKNTINGKEYDSLEDIPVELRDVFRKALTAWRFAAPAARPPARPAGSAGRGGRGTGPGADPGNVRGPSAAARRGAPAAPRPRAPSPAPPPSMTAPAESGRPFAIRALTWIAFLATVVLLFRLID